MKKIKILKENNGMYNIDTMYVNPKNVISIQSVSGIKRKLNENNSSDLVRNYSNFATVSIEGGATVTALGSPDDIRSAIGENTKNENRDLLFG